MARQADNAEVYRKSQQEKLSPDDWRDAVFTVPMAVAIVSFLSAGTFAVVTSASFLSGFRSHRQDIVALESFLLSADASPAYQKLHAVARAIAFLFQAWFCVHLYRNRSVLPVSLLFPRSTDPTTRASSNSPFPRPPCI